MTDAKVHKMKRTYICARCGGKFDSVDDEKAHAESLTLWGKRGDDPSMAEICHDCWLEFMKWHAAMRKQS